MVGKTIVVVEDEPKMMKNIVEWLEHRGARVMKAFNVREGLERAESARPDAIVLDLRLENVDGDGEEGFELLRRFKENRKTALVPVIIYSVMIDHPEVRRRAYRLNADLVLAKSMTSLDELEDAIANAIRRAEQHDQQDLPRRLLPIDYDEQLDTVYLQGAPAPVRLTPQERRLLVYLRANAGIYCSYNQIAAAVFDGLADDNAIQKAVSRLRHTLKDDARSPRLIQGAAGLGYRLAVAQE
jgi:DNA-binding response OmpR family regulator